MMETFFPFHENTDHLPYWAARAHLLAELRRNEEALMAFDRAIGLCGDLRVKEYLVERMRLVAAE
jgi:RNA polymerase sigma-70 factor (ECF subfamily)